MLFCGSACSLFLKASLTRLQLPCHIKSRGESERALIRPSTVAEDLCLQVAFFFNSRLYPDAFQLKCIDYHRFVLQQIWVFRGEKASTFFFFFFQIILIDVLTAPDRITKPGRPKHKASTKVIFLPN